MQIGHTRIDGGTGVVLAGTVGLAAFVAALYLPTSARQAEVRGQIDDLDREIASLENRILESHMPPDRIAERLLELRQTKARLEAQQNLSRLLRQLSLSTRDLDIQTQRQQSMQAAIAPAKAAAAPVPKDKEEADPVDRRTLSIVLQGRYMDLYQYLEAIERLPGVVRVTDLNIRRTPSDKSADKPSALADGDGFGRLPAAWRPTVVAWLDRIAQTRSDADLRGALQEPAPTGLSPQRLAFERTQWRLRRMQMEDPAGAGPALSVEARRSIDSFFAWVDRVTQVDRDSLLTVDLRIDIYAHRLLAGLVMPDIGKFPDEVQKAYRAHGEARCRQALAAVRAAIAAFGSRHARQGPEGRGPWPTLDELTTPGLVCQGDLPSNPFAPGLSNDVVAGRQRGTVLRGVDAGWCYQPTTGQFWCNTNTVGEAAW